ncbi:hypothetical protein NPIL_531211 [Nephila pilipes]|uniref:Reverse transcriptase n=1 Tax=Nephila pilipes TaxID=299642 RepID=A0A8X6NEX6_NEPPI|nr:hypothetical protein NPIL_531211 [Nephila pilipes]
MEVNKPLLRPYYIKSLFEEVLHEMKNSTVFSKLAIKDGYWHVKLDKESGLMTKFQTPFGRYRLRLPFRIKMAREVFQMRKKEAFEYSRSYKYFRRYCNSWKR